MSAVIRDSINKLIRRVVPKWVTTGEKLRVLKSHYIKVEITKTLGSCFGLNDGHIARCYCISGISNTHIGRTRKHCISIAYQELHKEIFFTTLHQ